MTDDMRARVRDVLPGVRRDLEALVRIESVSADSERAGEVRRSAEAVRDLFTTIEGCIDAGAVVTGPGGNTASGTFLGFNVADLDIVRHAPAEAAAREEAVLHTLRGAVI